MIPLRMFFGFEGEVLEVPGGFKDWFQQSFWTSESWSSPSPTKMPWEGFYLQQFG